MRYRRSTSRPKAPAAVDLARMARFYLDCRADFTCFAHPNVLANTAPPWRRPPA